MRNPLFDAPKAIDDKDILNEQEYLSSDEEVVEKVFSPRMTRSSSRSQAFLPRIQIQSDSSDFEEIQIIPEYKKFVLPPTPEPDDSAIDAEMQEKYSLTKYIHEIRST
ncbi:hypothetical protein TRFO_28319 [Tritrichomonas foetus]|uniref:Uncharacterized protein n=1 Tax=Tritrichomonas foetus TaxID=1144522 RepID=A0A1J4K0F2_9EUKA|nr:hypothetical protein TRFO_28319 [Tritrichomonas foetus]|eukprot:OHT04216.1 hypothetical protein TRFO_28319 [Tritrichomonas foetus]